MLDPKRPIREAEVALGLSLVRSSRPGALFPQDRRLLRLCHSLLDFLRGPRVRKYLPNYEVKVGRRSTRPFQMLQVKIVGTAVSLMAAGCAVVVVSWIGLALLGY